MPYQVESHSIFCDRLISLGIMSSRCIRIVAGVRMSFRVRRNDGGFLKERFLRGSRVPALRVSLSVVRRGPAWMLARVPCVPALSLHCRVTGPSPCASGAASLCRPGTSPLDSCRFLGSLLCLVMLEFGVCRCEGGGGWFGPSYLVFDLAVAREQWRITSDAPCQM